MASTMTAGTLGTVEVAWVDAQGNPAPVDGPTQWISTDPTIIEVTPGGGPPSGGGGAPGNPLICNIYSPGKLGTAQVQATADADMSPDVKSITALLDINVIGGMAVAGTLSFKQGPSGPPSPGGPSSPGGTAQPKPKK